MFRIFRAPRSEALSRGDTGRFWRYALGEIALVVLGILIALQIDNWNDERIEQRQIREYALNLVDDLDADMAMLEPVAVQISTLIARARLFADYARGRELADFDNALVFVHTDSLSYRPYGWNRSALDQLKASGALRQMRNTELVRLISAYDALTHHLDQDYANDMNDTDQARLMVNRVCDTNYADAGEYAAWQLSVDEGRSEPDWATLTEQPFFRALQAQQLQLLSEDVVELRALANQMIDVGSSLEARVGSEIPRLRGFAADIKRLVDAEYR